MSGSGNITPQSRTMMRPSTSTQAQLRPISPRPPRKTIRTAARPATRSRLGAGPGRHLRHRDPEPDQHPARFALELRRRLAERETALADGQPERPAGGLCGKRVRELLGRLEVVGLDE